ncbi:MAG TPA: SIMPL domain-containing protein [Microvirga sp.]|jgi:hypothetical protein|nr:SIMPL domain-containing protein [Microvirga sp.]
MRRSLPASALAALLLALPASAQVATPRPATVSVTGAAEVQLKPDFAHLYATVGTTGDTVGQITDANRAATERVLARLQAIGVKREDIRTLNLQVVQTPPRVDREGREIRAPRFTANHTLRVTTRDLDGVGRLVGEILSVGDLTFQSLAWGLDRDDEGLDEARRAAVRNARRQAETYAGAAGVTLGRLMEIRDGDTPSFRGESDMVQARMASAPSPGLAVVPPASVRATASVQMVWEIGP